MKILATADDVTEAVIADIEEAIGWFEGEARLDTEELIDRVAKNGNVADPPYDIESYDNPATRKIVRLARELRRDSQ